MNKKKADYSQQNLEKVIADSLSFSEVMTKLGLKQSGGCHSYIRKKVKEYNINTSHFKGRGYNKGKTFPKKYPLEEYLSNRKFIKSNELKKRLIKENVLDCKCYKCGIVEWQNVPAPLELHHIDCNHENNNLDNLTILCSNCHSIIHQELRNTDERSRTSKPFGATF